MEEVILTPSQQKAYDALLRGENVFLTGGAGTGKTTLIRKLSQKLIPIAAGHCLLLLPARPLLI